MGRGFLPSHNGNGCTIRNFRASGLSIDFDEEISMRTIVDWTYRETNREADALANGCSDLFNPALRIPVEANQPPWEVLPEELVMGRAAELEYRSVKDQGMLPDRGRQQIRRNPKGKLRNEDPV